MMSGVPNFRLLTCALAIAVSTALATVAPITAAHAADPPSLVIAGPTATATYGHAISISGRLTTDTPAADTPVPAAPVQLQMRPVGGAWTTVDTKSTDTDGRVAFARTAGKTADWQLVHAADAAAGEATSATIRVSVRAALTAGWTRAAVRQKHRAKLHGTVAPAGTSVRLEKVKSGSWTLVRNLPVSASGTFSTKVRGKKPGFKSYRIVRSATSSNLAASAALPRLDVYRLHTYIVRTRGHIVANLATFEASAAATYADPRGWLRAHHRFKRVSSGGDFTLLLAQARYLLSYSSVCSTLYSCRVGRNVIINQSRWRHSSVHFTGSKALYRQMVVNHETGHWLGRPHAFCSGPGKLAPVMQQQSKGMQGCLPNAWPLANEIHAVS
jgi:Protein of unknown function (DUF3152)